MNRINARFENILLFQPIPIQFKLNLNTNTKHMNSLNDISLRGTHSPCDSMSLWGTHSPWTHWVYEGLTHLERNEFTRDSLTLNSMSLRGTHSPWTQWVYEGLTHLVTRSIALLDMWLQSASANSYWPARMHRRMVWDICTLGFSE